ncbi:Ankyrin repeat protein [Giardia duodenalis assemblage B]|uniref:Ankyrin repeat protein n=1 Tax=Giardia duodenalis assemblage B TaxID=1394984 RepID=A0A132NP63_GIAIN|nr:Ankyrin repeat protein [Giardia intestinalis assemblage B]
MKLTSNYELGTPWGQGLDKRLYVVKAKGDQAQYICREISYSHLTPAQQERLFTRAAAARKMDCQYVGQIADIVCDESEQKYYLLYHAGQTFAELRILRKPSLDDVHSALMQLLKGLAYLHSPVKPGSDVGTVLAGILTPDRILYSQGILKIIDYVLLDSLAVGEASLTQRDMYCYAPPEVLLAVAQSQPQTTLTEKADLWSLGCIVYEFITGLRPLKLDPITDAYNKSMSIIETISLPLSYDKDIKPIIAILLSVIPARRLPATALQNNPKVTSAPLLLYNGRNLTGLKTEDFDLLDYSDSGTVCAESVSSDQDAPAPVPTENECVPTKLDAADDSESVISSATTAMTSLPADCEKPPEAVEEQWTDMMIAARNNDRHSVKKLMQRYSAIVDAAGRTALMHAAICGHLAVIKLLVKTEKGKMCTERGWTALMYAACHDNADACKVLCKYEGGMATKNGFTALMIATQQNSLGAIAELASKEGKLKDSTGNTALMMAAKAGNKDAVRYLHALEGKLQNDNGYAAIHIAAEENKAEILPFLIKREASCLAPGGLTALHVAALSDSTDSLLYLLHSLHSFKTERGYTALMLAAMEDLPDAVEILIKEETRMKDSNGCTALIHAARKNSFGVIRDLLPLEGKLTDSAGCTALHHAVMCKSKDCVRILAPYEWNIANIDGKKPIDLANELGEHDLKTIIDTGVSHKPLLDLESNTSSARCESTLTDLMKAVKACSVPQVKEFMHQAGRFSTAGYTALAYAAVLNYADLAALLIEKEAGLQVPLPTDPKEKVWEGCTALMLAVWHGHIEVARLLLPHEAKLQRRDGRTALMLASAKGHEDIVSLLIPYEAGMKDRRRYTALALAAQRGCLNTIKLLAPHEARIPTRRGFSALMFAVQEGHTKSVGYLAKHESGMQLRNGQTALMSAASHGFIKCLSILLPYEKGMQRTDGYTALMSACKHAHVEAINLLVDHELNLRTKDGRGAWDFVKTKAAADALKQLSASKS